MKIQNKKIILCSVLYAAILIMSLLHLFTLYGCIAAIVISVILISLEVYKSSKDSSSDDRISVAFSHFLMTNVFLLFLCIFFKYIDITTLISKFQKFLTPIVIYVLISIGLIVAVKMLNLSKHPIKVLLRYIALSAVFIIILNIRLHKIPEIITLSAILNILIFFIDLIGSKRSSSNFIVYVLALLSNFLLFFMLLTTKSIRNAVFKRVNGLSFLSWSIWQFLIIGFLFIAIGIVIYELDRKNDSITNDYINVLLVGYNLEFLMLVDRFSNSYSLVFIAVLFIFDAIVLNSSFSPEVEETETNSFKQLLQRHKFLTLIAAMLGLVVLMVSFKNGVMDIVLAVMFDFYIIFFVKKSKYGSLIKAFMTYLTFLLICFHINCNAKVFMLATMFFAIVALALIALNSVNGNYNGDIEKYNRGIIFSLFVIALLVVSIISGVSCKGFDKEIKPSEGDPYVLISCENRNKASEISEVRYYWNFDTKKQKKVSLKEDGSFKIKLSDDKRILTVIIVDSENVVSRYVHVY